MDQDAESGLAESNRLKDPYIKRAKIRTKDRAVGGSLRENEKTGIKTVGSRKFVN